MSELANKSKSRTAVLFFLIGSQVLAVMSLLIWLFAALASVMALDSGQTREAWTSVISVWSYPIFPIAMAVGAWIAYARGRNIPAMIPSGLTFAPSLLLYLGLAVGSLVPFLQH